MSGYAPVAQLAEQLPLKELVPSSTLGRGTLQNVNNRVY